MRKYKLEGKLTGFHSMRLLDIDKQEKIIEISETLAELCEPVPPVATPQE